MRADGINEVFQTNFFGAVKLIQKVLPRMRERKDGVIVNVSSSAAISAGVGSGYYAATKAALELVPDALWQEVSPLGIKVMIVEPGDPIRGGEVIIDTILKDNYPRRLLLGIM